MATLHNAIQVGIKDVRPGDTVIVRKAGDVIPEVVGPVLSERPEGTEAWVFPSNCPSCGQPLTRGEGDGHHYCTNLDCPSRQTAAVEYFASRTAMDIEGLGEKSVRLFTNLGLISDIGDIYSLDAERLLEIERFGETSVTNLIEAIDASKSRDLQRLLVGLNIAHLGPTGADALARGFGHLDAIAAAGAERIAELDGVGPTIAESVDAWFASERNQEVIEKLRAAGVNFEGPEVIEVAQTLEAKSVVVTGTLEGFNRTEAATAIKVRGGKSPGSVSKSTLALVVGDGAGGSKLNKATDLGVPQLDEAQFVRLLETGELPEQPGAADGE